ncbi:MAG TPA: 50S ribosomal protein L3 [Polyangiaceae bacterium]|jgi:large subunit ribosomal protein L3|nr:50S ribosomal protein L3 [Polyangiaceae bacterium]
MNQFPGVIGRKLGMTQIFLDDGSVVPCTVVESNIIVVGKRTLEKDGYDAIIVGSGVRKEKHTTKALAGAFKKAGVEPRRTLRELRCSAEFAASVEVGAALKVDQLFEAGQFVDVQGTSKGRGFTGVMRRHHFSGNVRTHGTHEYRRHGGSIGTNMTPGRVKKGMKMPGQHGNKTRSVLNQKVVKVIAETNLILIHGGIPGSRNGLVFVRGAVKKRGGKASA